jgi:hypothetical protein
MIGDFGVNDEDDTGRSDMGIWCLASKDVKAICMRSMGNHTPTCAIIKFSGPLLVWCGVAIPIPFSLQPAAGRAKDFGGYSKRVRGFILLSSKGSRRMPSENFRRLLSPTI